MTEPSCKECFFWSNPTRNMDVDWGDCESSRSKDGDPLNKITLAFACDLDSYSAVLCTHESFSCSMFKPK